MQESLTLFSEDTTTPAGKALFLMMGVFAEFERGMIQERVRACSVQLLRAGGSADRRWTQRRTGQSGPAVRKGKDSVRTMAKAVGVGSGTVQRIKMEIAAGR